MSVNLGRVRVLGADAVGLPGQRRFRLFVQSSSGSALLWMEKEQLRSLSVALDQALAQLTEGQLLRTEAQAGGVPKPTSIPADFPTAPTYDFQIGEIRINYEDSENLFLLNVVPLEVLLEGDEATLRLREEEELSFLFSHQEAHALSTTITSVVLSGRPVCPLCGTPLDGGPHACVRQNGHREIFQVEEE